MSPGWSLASAAETVFHGDVTVPGFVSFPDGDTKRGAAAATAAWTASQASPTCQVLDLVLGPLNVQLLGLVVDLNQVHLTITATRGGGILGDVFCQLADEHPATTTSTTPATSTG